MSSFIVSPVVAAGIMDLRPGLTIWTAITFLLLVVVLSKFAWGPIVRMLDERERTIREAIEQAKKERAEAERALADQKTKLAAAQRAAASSSRLSTRRASARSSRSTSRSCPRIGQPRWWGRYRPPMTPAHWGRAASGSSSVRKKGPACRGLSVR
jgi:F-type H+-transporting ATPase subunit b